MQSKRVALVTGANKGIGLQIAKDLVSHGFTVLIGSRNLENGQNAANHIGSDAHALQLDVTDPQSIASAAAYIKDTFGHLDVLINNAAVSHAAKAGDPFPQGGPASGLLTVASIEDIRSIYDTNVFGVIAVTQAMLPLLHQSSAPRIVNMGSTGGSLSWNSTPGNDHRAMFGAYSASKSAVHAVTLAFAFALESTPIKVNAACPGHTSTALNNYSGARTVEQGAKEAVRLAMLGPEGPTGTFSDENGAVAW